MTAGYSGTPLARKLGIQEGHVVLLLHPPPGFPEELSPLPKGVEVQTQEAGSSARGRVDREGKSRFDVVLLFCPDAAALHDRFGPAVARIRWNGGLWACWPKKSSPIHSDLAREEVRTVGLAAGLVDNKVCAVNQDWSALRFVVRTEDRPASTDEGGPTTGDRGPDG